MREPFSPSAVLDAWEAGAHQRPVERALTMLAVLAPGERAAETSVGARDRLLLDLRERIFGPELDAVADCPRCAERLDVTLRTPEIRAPEADPDRKLMLAAKGVVVRYRLPNSLDLLQVGEATAAGAKALLRRCVVEVLRDGVALPDPPLDEELIAAVEEAMSDADPQADVTVQLSCPSCGHRWQTVFDIVAFLWSDFDRWAQDLLHDVHALAAAYGWSEREVLALSPFRRSAYRALVQQ